MLGTRKKPRPLRMNALDLLNSALPAVAPARRTRPFAGPVATVARRGDPCPRSRQAGAFPPATNPRRGTHCPGRTARRTSSQQRARCCRIRIDQGPRALHSRHDRGRDCRIDAQHAKIPAQEQLLSAGCVAYNLLLGAQALGFAAQWLTGWAAYDADAATLFRLSAGEHIIAFVHIGTAREEAPERTRPVLAEVLSEWHA